MLVLLDHLNVGHLLLQQQMLSLFTSCHNSNCSVLMAGNFVYSWYSIGYWGIAIDKGRSMSGLHPFGSCRRSSISQTILMPATTMQAVAKLHGQQ